MFIVHFHGSCYICHMRRYCKTMRGDLYDSYSVVAVSLLMTVYQPKRVAVALYSIQKLVAIDGYCSLSE